MASCPVDAIDMTIGTLTAWASANRAPFSAASQVRVLSHVLVTRRAVTMKLRVAATSGTDAVRFCGSSGDPGTNDPCIGTLYRIVPFARGDIMHVICAEQARLLIEKTRQPGSRGVCDG